MVKTRTRVCPQCEQPFTYEVGTGKDRKMCSEACGRQASQKRFKVKLAILHANCRVDGCTRTVTRLRTRLCEGCYARLRRNGDTSYRRKAARLRTMHSNGYVQLYVPHHPLFQHGSVGEHRVVLYEAIGPGPHPCHWCGTMVRWDVAKGENRLVVDHLNDVKTDNRPENLVPSCNDCNRARGAMLPFLGRLLPGSLDHLIELIRQAGQREAMELRR